MKHESPSPLLKQLLPCIYRSSHQTTARLSSLPPPPGLPVPKPREVIPRIITYQRKRANRRILNEPEFIEMLKEFGELQVGGMHGDRGQCLQTLVAWRPGRDSMCSGAAAQLLRRSFSQYHDAALPPPPFESAYIFRPHPRDPRCIPPPHPIHADGGV